jgi:3-hydroxybutyryl-CoA dehydrogenase
MSLSTLAIVGAGTMGSGIAINAAQHGYRVVLIDAVDGAVARAQKRAAGVFARWVDKGRMTAQEAEAASARLVEGKDASAVAEADLVIEAVFEDFKLKADLFQRLSSHLKPTALVATNTSCLRVADLAAHVGDPSRFLGLHYFSPAEVNPVCELVRGPRTADAAATAAADFLKRTQRVAIPCRDSYGFALNRFFCPYTNEAGRLLAEGFGTAEIDRVVRESFGAAAGPFLVMNIIKPVINTHAIRNLAPLGAFYAPCDAFEMIAAYQGLWDIDESADPKNRTRDAAIAARMLGATFLPVLQVLDEGVADAAAIDLGAAQAFKWAKTPCATMDALGQAEVARIVGALTSAHGLPLPKSLQRVGTLTKA